MTDCPVCIAMDNQVAHNPNEAAADQFTAVLRDASTLIDTLWATLADMDDGDVAPSDGRDLRGSILP